MYGICDILIFQVFSSTSVGTRIPSIKLTAYSIHNEDGELAVGLECANTHSLLSQKDSQAKSQMIRNLSKNELAESTQQEIEVSLSATGLFTAGANSVTLVLQVGLLSSRSSESALDYYHKASKKTPQIGNNFQS